jgi:hypothetical protein
MLIGTEAARIDWSDPGVDNAKRNRDANTAETGEQVPARRHDAGSGANETIDGLDGITEELRHAAEDMRSGSGPGKIENTPVFDRGDLAPII